MNRRTFVQAAVAAVALPTTLSITMPTATPGQSWDEWAFDMACWERSANRDNFGFEWRSVRERDWIPWNHRRDTTKPDAVSLVYLASPELRAEIELVDAMHTLYGAGVYVLGNAVTVDNYAATAFVWADHNRVAEVLGEWRIVRPKSPCELDDGWTDEV